MPVNIKVNGEFKNAIPYVKVNGVWAPVVDGWVKVAGEWRRIFASASGVPAGPTDFIAFDTNTDTGYYGEVFSPDLPTGDELAAQIGLTEGTSVNSTYGWFKFHVGANAICNRFPDGNGGFRPYDLYISRREFRNNVSSASITPLITSRTWYGTTSTQPVEIQWEGKSYIIRMVHGASEDPTFGSGSGNDPANTHNSEWNHLIYRIHANSPTSQAGSNWASYSNTEINVGTGGTGAAQHCREVDDNELSPGGPVIGRGYSDLSHYMVLGGSSTDPAIGWRPCLMVFTDV